MRRDRRVIGSVALFLVSACGAPLEPEEHHGTARAKSVPLSHPMPPGGTFFDNPGRFLAGTLTDWSGTVTTRVWACLTAGHGGVPAVHAPVAQCRVADDEVLVGGGATASFDGPGALLTASYPADPRNLTTWEARSKDHGAADPHHLIVYAVGLRLQGVSRATLLSNMFVNQMSQGPASHPMANAGAFPADILALGDGAIVDWRGAGNMLTWTAGGAFAKDHVWADPSVITHYQIGINRTIPGFQGTLANGSFHQAVNGAGHVSVNFDLPEGQALTGLSGAVSGIGAGSPGLLLTSIGLRDLTMATRYEARAKDHLHADTGTVVGMARFLARKR